MLVDTVVGDAMKYPVKYITAPALMMISKTKDLAPAKRRYPHIGRLVEAFISPLLATVGIDYSHTWVVSRPRVTHPPFSFPLGLKGILALMTAFLCP